MAAGDAAEAAATSGGKDSRDHQHSVLTEKVSRALEVRTDTPAMKAALDALAHLPDHNLDSRSVRVAIEQDALQQALLLQGELQKLLDTVVALRQGVTETAAIAHRVSDAIHANVITTTTTSTIGAGNVLETTTTTATSGSAGDVTTSPGGDGPTGSEEMAPPGSQIMTSEGPNNEDDSLEREQQLASLISDAFHQRNVARKRLEAVQAFLEKFDLKEEDARLLDNYAFDDVFDSGTPTASGMAFLAALERVRLIRKELGRTFGRIDALHQQQHRESSATGDNNRLGASSALRMMETLAQKQERAYERLYHWLQKFLQLHSHSADASAPVPDDDRLDEALSNPFVRRSLFALRHVPAFYSHLLELVAGTRRSEETRRFLLALTSGYGGFPPIEIKAHDSVVYVGDMLAFCFRAFSVEADVAKGLFNYKLEDENSEDGGGKEEQNERDSILPEEEEESMYLAEKPMTAIEMLSQGMSGVARPLKSRILQVVANLSRRSDTEDDDDADSGIDDDLEEEGSVARSRLSQLYEICGLLLFYMSALEKGIHKLHVQEAEKMGTPASDIEAFPIVMAIMDCLGEATKAYEASLRVYGAMLEQLNILTGEPEASLAHTMIVRLVSVRQGSPGFARDVACPKDFQTTLSLEWACSVLVEAALPNSKSLDDAVSLKQCIAIVNDAGMTSETTDKLTVMVQEKETSLIDVLVEKETTDVLDLCGLGSLSSALKNFQGLKVEGMIMATHPGLTPEDVESVMKEFYSSLYSPPIPSFESVVKDPAMRKLARTKIASNVCSKYAELHNAIISNDGGYDDLSFLGHTPSQVQTLFSV